MTIRVAIAGLDKEIVELVLQTPDMECLGVFDPVDVGETLGCPWLGPDSEWARIRELETGARIIVGVDLPPIRKELISHFGVQFVMGIQAGSAQLSKFANVCSTAVVQTGVQVHADAVIGMGCKINHGAAIHHDCLIENYCTISPGARLLGNAHLEEAVFVGAGAVVLPHVVVGRGATIGAGAVVINDVRRGSTVVGIPARVIKEK